MRKSGVTEKYERIVHDMYEDSATAEVCGRSDGGVRGS